MDRMRRRQSGSARDKRRSLQLPPSLAPDLGARPAYKVVTSSRPHRHGLASASTAHHQAWSTSAGGAWGRRRFQQGGARTQARQLGNLGKLLPRWAEDILQQVFASFVF